MPGGRPTDYRDEYADQVYKLALLGLTDAEMAKFFEVDERTINRWKDAHPEFCQSLARGKAPADGEVVASLYHRAKGYSHPDVHVSSYEGDITITDIVRHYPPDTQAASLWLRNRQPAKWRDKQEHEHTGKDGQDLIPAEPDRGKLLLAMLVLLQAPVNPDSSPLAIETTPTLPE